VKYAALLGPNNFVFTISRFLPWSRRSIMRGGAVSTGCRNSGDSSTDRKQESTSRNSKTVKLGISSKIIDRII
jgi:hypothetical protein